MSDHGLFSAITRFFSSGSSASVKTIPGYDPEKHIPVIRVSICTGEQTGGYQDKTGGTFHEVMLIQNEKDLEEFQKMIGTDNIKKIY